MPVPERPSLLDGIVISIARMRPGRRMRLSAASRITLAICAAAALAALLTTGIAAWIGARGLEREARQRSGSAADVAADRRGLDAMGRLSSSPGMERMVAELAAHLPRDAKLVAIAREEEGGFAVTLETPDPDLLRNALASEPWFRRFVERRQAIIPGGGMRVTLVRG